MKRTLMPIILLLIGFSGCAKPIAKNHLQPKIKEFYDIPYYIGKDVDSIKHKLNLFVPDEVENPPIMLWIHGGAWAFGGRKFETDLARKFAQEGIAVAAVSYRLSPGTWKDPRFSEGIQHPEHIKDIARAFAWIYDNAEKYDYDQNSIFVSGYSAGGHLSALLAMDPRYLAAVDRSVKDIKAVIPIAGAYDIVAYHNAHLKYNGKAMAEKHVNAVFGNSTERHKEASPTNYIKNQWSPMLVISEKDTYEYTKILEDLAKREDYDDMDFFHVRDKDHMGLFNDLSKNEESRYRKIIVDYIKKNTTNYDYLDRGDFKLAYKIFGEGNPLFLLNGGPGFASHHFEEFAKTLAETHKVIIFDQRGTGYSKISPRDKDVITIDHMVEDLEVLRNHLGHDEITILGHSFGGIYAMHYVEKYPKRVKAMVLSHSGGFNLDFLREYNSRLLRRLDESEKTSLWSSEGIDNPDLRLLQRYRAIAGGFTFREENEDRIFKGLAFKTRYHDEINQLVWRSLRERSHDLSESMNKFANPVLIIHGDNDIVNPIYAEEMHNGFPNSVFALLEDCGHYGWLDKPETYYSSLKRFLSTI